VKIESHAFHKKCVKEYAELILVPGAATPLATVGAPETKVCVIIGPEGGFSADEADVAVKKGAVPVTLGPHILRVETAGVVAATLVLHELGVL